ncbi:ADP-ribosylation factor-related protein 1, partial [Eschrichtius robustus]|nr:ADP-ribosylation factor-related protein 1 [Eschrichtius robustus]
MSDLYKDMLLKDQYCILILGLDNAGKTTFLEQSKTRFNKNYKGMTLSKITTTVGLNIGTVDFGKARLMFWDLGGQEELQSLWDKPRALQCEATGDTTIRAWARRVPRAQGSPSRSGFGSRSAPGVPLLSLPLLPGRHPMPEGVAVDLAPSAGAPSAGARLHTD